jgi:hypothetical protein
MKALKSISLSLFLALILAGCSSTITQADGATATPAAACSGQVQEWLAKPAASAAGNSVQHDISAIMSGATTYLGYARRRPAAGQVFLKGLSVFVSTLSRGPHIPSCADPSNLWGANLTPGSFLGDASIASKAKAGSSQAKSDCRAVVTDFNGLLAELSGTAPGSKIEG